MRLGAYPAILKKGSLIQKLYDSEQVSERHRHRYEVNPEYVEKLEEKGFAVTGFFYNPNIHPYQEYQKRLEALKIIFRTG
jgi:CTP synthase